MIRSRKSPAPALDVGLDIIEHLSLCKEAGFNELCAILPMSKASVSRVLKTLAGRGYVRKDSRSGKWLPGSRIGMAGLALPVQETLAKEAPALLKSFVDKAGNTALCVYWTGEEFQVLAKEQREGGIVMLDVGTVSRDLSRFPWGWLFYLSLDKAGRAKAMRNVEDKAFFEKRIPAWTSHIREHGFAFDDHEIYPARMRFGAPVLDQSGAVVGAIGSAATRLSLPPKGLDFLCSALLEAAVALSAKLGGKARMNREALK